VLVNYIKFLGRYEKKFLIIFNDVVLLNISLIISFFIIQKKIDFDISLLYLFYTPIFISIFQITQIYSNIIRYFSIDNIRQITFGITLYFIIVSIFSALFIDEKSLIILNLIHVLLLFFFLVYGRIIAFYLVNQKKNNKNKIKVAVYGAGKGGYELINSMQQSNKYEVIGIIDDDEKKQNRKILNIKIYNPTDIDYLIQTYNFRELIIAIPSLDLDSKRRIIQKIVNKNLLVRTLPTLTDIISNKVSLLDIKKLDEIDILDRKIIIDNNEISKKIKNQNILITGSGGSIGSELSLQCITNKPNLLIIIDHSEYNLYTIEKKLTKIKKDLNLKTQIVPILISVQDRDGIKEIFEKYSINLIYHAAAYKHVNLGEKNQIEFLKNNIYGTLNIAELAYEYECNNFVLVSTDKAVRPSNIMGASKRFSELIVQGISNKNDSSKTIMSIVRFGNVIGSSGSVIPLFQSQISEGGPITITHPEVTRYFMTIPESVSLILLSSCIAKGGEVYVLDMGKPIKIFDMASKIVSLSGLKITNNIKENGNGKIGINYIGLKKGEKLHEELFIGNNLTRTNIKDIFVANEEYIEWSKLILIIKKLQSAINSRENNSVIQILESCIEDFKTIDVINEN
jgi:FlaA1/EpsC-like NDP-sugar epimerase